MQTLSGSELAIGFYPRFIYNSAGGGGVAKASKNGSSRLDIVFDPATVNIPDVTGKTSTAQAPSKIALYSSQVGRCAHF